MVIARQAVHRHRTENLKQIFPEMKLWGLVPNSYIHVSVSDLYIPIIGMPILMQQYRWTDRGNIKIAHRYMCVEIGNWERGHAVSFLGIHKLDQGSVHLIMCSEPCKLNS
jgi:hypothetical protein